MSWRWMEILWYIMSVFVTKLLVPVAQIELGCYNLCNDWRTKHTQICMYFFIKTPLPRISGSKRVKKVSKVWETVHLNLHCILLCLRFAFSYVHLHIFICISICIWHSHSIYICIILHLHPPFAYFLFSFAYLRFSFCLFSLASFIWVFSFAYFHLHICRYIICILPFCYIT